MGWLASVFLCRQAAELGERPAEAEQAEVEQVRPSNAVQHPHPSNQNDPADRRFFGIEDGDCPEQNDAEHKSQQAKPEAVRRRGHHVQDAEADHDCHSGDGEDGIHENIIHAPRIEPKTPAAGKVLVRFSSDSQIALWLQGGLAQSFQGMADRMITDVLTEPDAALDGTLRPGAFSEFTGQLKVKERLGIAVEAAKQRSEALDHILLSGPSGLGKTTLAGILAREMGSDMKVTSGPIIEKAADLAGLLTNLNQGDVLFIDEIHRLQKNIEEYLYPAMEDFTLDIIIDQGPSARSVRLNLPKFTLIGATTRSGLLTAPLLTRFPVRERLDYYVADDLQTIVRRSAGLLNVEIDTDGSAEVARRSRGTPRIANNLLRRVRDYAQVKGDGRIDSGTADRALAMLEIDEDGLDEMDKRILQAIIVKFSGGPVGLSSLAVAVGEEPDTLEEVYEPFLILEGYLNRTPQGRVATEASFNKLGLKSLNKNSQQNLL